MADTPRISFQLPEVLSSFAENGYYIFRNAVSKSALAELRLHILDEFERAKAGGTLFKGGGLLHGHLNCFPGEVSRFVYEAVKAQGILGVVQELSEVPLRLPNIGCNLNLPGSNPQNVHVDGYSASEFMVVNIAAVDTNLQNGAMEVLPGTHRTTYKYWELVMARPRKLRVELEQGDVVIRTSMLWHRGMPNKSALARPMLALTWEDGGSKLDDPYRANDGKISFFPNRYSPDFAGRMRERAFTHAPEVVSSGFRFVRSFFDS